eukprot:CAMPEP_0117424056 /NCGR_PEP_ID=MMETSP0758-20121206/4554_1 /TAXON_ID=63605 /ORGANISM="Percolomonas cosmopolitus, Strain AE-1 (ATCC 50343)" /LENGTH=244 /DNA_ID=CAMNT_0005207611 /DNA_START=319 /DNA_END=1053 /DNA_ORIENTATION=+
MKKTNGTSYNSGDLIISNHVSYLDVIYWVYKANNPIFAAITTQDIFSKPKIIEMSGWKYMWNMIYNKEIKFSDKRAKQLSDAIKTTKKTVIIFPEGTTTNGRGIMQFASVFINNSGIQSDSEDDEEEQEEQTMVGNIIQQRGGKIHVVGIRYGNGRTQSPAYHHTQPIMNHILYNIAELTNTMEIYEYAPEKETNLSFLIEKSRHLITKLFGVKNIPMLQSTRKDKASFLKYWTLTQQKAYHSK